MNRKHVIEDKPRNKSVSSKDILSDYALAYRSRLASIIGRKEVLLGKASFGIFGEGIELPQIVLSKFFRKGDFKTGYYRDQTIALATKEASLREFFAQLYANADLRYDPHSCGRQMSSFLSTRLLDKDGQFKDQTETQNIISEIASTSGQMPRILGLAYASKLYRELEGLKQHSKKFSRLGHEVVFGTIGDASTSEGLFFETMNAACVLQVPLIMSVWDNGYGISVPRHLQTTHDSISKAMSGFKRDGQSGMDIYEVKAYDYLALHRVYETAVERARQKHIPSLIHIKDITQPQGHSTSGSHERYKSKKRLLWEKENDCIKKFREWIIANKLAHDNDLSDIEKKEKEHVSREQKDAWSDYLSSLKEEKKKLFDIIDDELGSESFSYDIKKDIESSPLLNRRLLVSKSFELLTHAYKKNFDPKKLKTWHGHYLKSQCQNYESNMMSEGSLSPLHIMSTSPQYLTENYVDGRLLIKKCFQENLLKYPELFILGEDVGELGGVNLEFEGLQKAFGKLRVTDTGIREASILGQGIGCAIRGLRPIVDIQYLDYILFALQTASDDLATLRYRTAGGQKSPVIVRTKGHRLEGIWHTGSPMSMLLGSLRGMHICVPRNMTQACGLYNTLLKGDDPALVIEVLNGYRLKERVPDNLSDFTVSLGEAEILQEGHDITLVTYGACCQVALEAARMSKDFNISIEVIDIQTLLPFDRFGVIEKSLRKTHALLVMDEDVPNGASSFILSQILESQKGFDLLDRPPRTLTATEHRTPYGRDGDYFSKPQVEDVLRLVGEILEEKSLKLF